MCVQANADNCSGCVNVMAVLCASAN